jgi:hypothetical protein
LKFRFQILNFTIPTITIKLGDLPSSIFDKDLFRLTMSLDQSLLWDSDERPSHPIRGHVNGVPNPTLFADVTHINRSVSKASFVHRDINV